MDPSRATLPRSRAAHAGSRRWSGGVRSLVLATVATAATALAARVVRRVEVTGDSMTPTLRAGDRLVVLAPPWGARPEPGDVVAVPDPRAPGRLLVKRVAAVDHARGTVDVRGDAPGASTDSRTFGPVPRASVVGRAVYRYAPPGRTGPLARPTGYDRG